MEQIPFEIRLVSLENLNRLSEMFYLCLGRKVGTEYFEWKYKNNPSGSVIAFEAVHNNIIAGFYGVIPEVYIVGGKEVLVYQSMDTMTHPDFQKKGLFTTLARKTYNYLQEINEQVYITGIPGSNSFHGFVNKLNWKNTHNFKYIFIHKLLSKASTLFCTYSDWNFSYTKEIDLELEQLLAYFLTTDRGILQKIDKQVLEWKVLHHPFKEFKIVKIYNRKLLAGYCVLSIDEKNDIKIEILKLKDTVKNAVPALTHFLFQTNHDSHLVYTWTPTNKKLKSLYKQAGYFANPYKKGPFSYRIPFIVYSNVKKIEDFSWFNPDHFDIQPLMQD